MGKLTEAWNKLMGVEKHSDQNIEDLLNISRTSRELMNKIMEERIPKTAKTLMTIHCDGKSAEEIKKILEKDFATSGVIEVSDPIIFAPLTKEQIIDLEKLPLQPLHMVYPDIIANELMSKIKDGIDKSVQELREKGYTDEEILNKLGKQQEYYNKLTGDIRYNEPKSEPETSYEDAEDAIQANQIYREAKERILRAQNHQVRYGLDKYPEALNPDSWDILETIDHAMDEMVDQMHYMQMLRIKLEERLEDNPFKKDLEDK